MIGFGALSLLKGLGLIYISWKVIFPIGIIGLGLMMVFRASKRSKQSSASGEAASGYAQDASIFGVDEGETGERVLDLTAILGGVQRKVTTQDFRGGDLSSIMCYSQLQRAQVLASFFSFSLSLRDPPTALGSVRIDIR